MNFYWYKKETKLNPVKMLFKKNTAPCSKITENLEKIIIILNIKD